MLQIGLGSCGRVLRGDLVHLLVAATDSYMDLFAFLPTEPRPEPRSPAIDDDLLCHRM